MTDNMRPEIKAATSRAMLDRGCVNVIGLEAFKANAGAHWDRLREPIYTRTEALLAQKLGPADFYVRLNDTAYLVTMPSSDREDAKICCLRVIHDLHASLLGHCSIEDIALFHAAHSSDDSFELQQIARPEIQKIARHAGLNDLATSEASPGNAMRANQNKPARKPEAEAIFCHSFLPIWDARREAITAYRILTKRQSGDAAGGYSHGLKDELALTLASIYHAVETLARHLEAGEKFLMIIPVSYEVLSSPVGRMEIGGACRDLSSDFRPFLVFEISDLPTGVPQSRLNDLATIVKPFCKGIMVQIPMGTRNFAPYQGLGLHSIGIIFPRQHMPMTQIQDEIARLVEGAKRIGLMSFLGNVTTVDTIFHARNAGVNLMGGSAVEPPTKSPKPMRRLAAAQIISAQV